MGNDGIMGDVFDIVGRGNLLEKTKKTDDFWCPECMDQNFYSWVDYGKCCKKCGYRFCEKDAEKIKKIMREN